MCGIVGFIGNETAAPLLLEGLEKLEYRGYDSAGIAVMEKDSLFVLKTERGVSGLKKEKESIKKFKSCLGIGHTRWSTHGAPCKRNAHPHLSYKKRFAIVHNGIIENYAELKDELIARGIVFKSETDTEVIAHLLDLYFEGDVLKAILKTISRLKGSYSLGILCTNSPNRLYAVCQFSPLIIGIGENENYMASDIMAFVSHTKRVIHLSDGEIAEITGESVNIYLSSGEKIHRKSSLIDWNIYAPEKAGYNHFMMKEIKEQPYVIAKTFKTYIKNNKVSFGDLKINDNKIKTINKIFITGCGSAYHAGVVAKYFFEEILRISTEVDLASEFRYRNPIIDDKTLVIVISQSGETADTIAALKEAKSKGAYVLAIVNVMGSSISKGSDDVIYTKAGPEISVATTKAYSAQIMVLYLLGIYIAEKRKSCDFSLLKQLIFEIKSLPDKVSEVFELEEQLKRLAKSHHTAKNMFFIGRNIDYAVAMEASLKLKEISYIGSEAYAAGELKHGTISLIEEGKTVIALSAYGGLTEKTISNIKEVKARGAFVIATAEKKNLAIESATDEVIYLPDTHPLLIASTEVVSMQIFAYYIALYNGCDIDKPRNLAKSVTVE